MQKFTKGEFIFNNKENNILSSFSYSIFNVEFDVKH